MARQKQMYAVMILLKGNKVKYVTSLGDHHTAHWDAGQKAMLFDKDLALDMCKGFAWNGISAVPVMNVDWINLKNPVEEEQK